MFLISWMDESTRTWISENGISLVLGGLVFVQWVLLQAFWIHYSLFRAKLQKPNRDLIRMNLLEKTVAFQADQINAAFKKMNDLRREVSQAAQLHEAALDDLSHQNARGGRDGTSLESTYVSMGELQLKRRLDAMKASVSAAAATSPKEPTSIQ